jgi:hypothetical protein
MKSYSTFVENLNKRLNHKKRNKVNDGDDKPEKSNFVASEDEYLHEPGDTGIGSVG